jgi:hypothetical protein
MKGNCSSLFESVIFSGENSLMQTETKTIKDLTIVGFQTETPFLHFVTRGGDNYSNTVGRKILGKYRTLDL